MDKLSQNRLGRNRRTSHPLLCEMSRLEHPHVESAHIPPTVQRTINKHRELRLPVTCHYLPQWRKAANKAWRAPWTTLQTKLPTQGRWQADVRKKNKRPQQLCPSWQQQHVHASLSHTSKSMPSFQLTSLSGTTQTQDPSPEIAGWKKLNALSTPWSPSS